MAFEARFNRSAESWLVIAGVWWESLELFELQGLPQSAADDHA
jgi:hypothetical protein